jgi:hypothetical protein
MSQSTTFEQIPLFDVDEIPWGYCYDCYLKVEFDINHRLPWCSNCSKEVHSYDWTTTAKFKPIRISPSQVLKSNTVPW